MSAKCRFLSLSVGLLALLMVVPACATSLNKSIRIEAGETSSGASTVNGSIKVGTGAIVTGKVSTVNGTIRVEEDARVEKVSTVNGSVRVFDGVQSESLGTVNGSIQVGSKVTVDGEVTAVNGKIVLDSGTKVSGDISNVNGEIKLRGAEVGGDLETENGDVMLSEKAVLKGDLTVEKPSRRGNTYNSRDPRIVIGPGSRVEGSIVLKRQVELFISTSAEVGAIGGVMSMDDAVRFDGEKP
jgi:DUF4097 and DUF4098 domain-containing protein YvlB